MPAESISARQPVSIESVDEGAVVPYQVFDPRYLPPRQYVNPIRGLTPAKLIYLIDWGQYGFKADLQWTYAAMERKEPVLRALKERRLAAIKKLKWTVRVKEEFRDEKDDAGLQAEIEAQTQELQSVYGEVENLREALGFMALATFRGFAHLEIHLDDEGAIRRLEPVPQWYWCFSYPVKDWLFNPQALQTNQGRPIDPAAFVVREVEDPLDEVASIIFLRKNLSKKDWDLFVETYGVPSLFTEFSEGKSEVRSSDLTTAVAMANKVIANGRGALPPGMKLSSTNTAIGGTTNHPFREHLDYNNMELVLAGTGGKLTMLAEATGIGAGASPAHEAVFADIAAAEGEEIAEVMRGQVDEPELRRRGYERPLVEFALEMQAPEDKEKNANILGAIAAAGFRVSDEDASEMLEMEVRSVIGQGPSDMFGGQEPGQEPMPEEAAGAAPGEESMPAGEEGAPNRYFDAPPQDKAWAPFYESATKHPQKRSDVVPGPYYPPGVHNSDPPYTLTKYPTAEERDRWMGSVREAIERYRQAYAKGTAADLGPLREEVRRILEIKDPKELALRLAELEKELPDWLTSMLRDSQAAGAMEKVLMESIVKGAHPVNP